MAPDTVARGEHIGAGLVAPEHLRRIWPHVRHWIGAALEHYCGRPQTARLLCLRVRRRRYGLLVASSGARLVAAVVLEFFELRGERLLAVVAAGGAPGSLELVGPMLWAEVQSIARALGADSVRVEGRRGWLRWIRAEGGRLRQVVIDFPVRD